MTGGVGGDESGDVSVGRHGAAGGGGIELAQAYAAAVVSPLVASRWPRMPYAAARLGSGSDVLGLDDATSRDHDWGLRLNLLVPVGAVAEVDRGLAADLPETFAGHPVRFATTWDPVVRQRVQVDTAAGFAYSRLGVDPTRGLTVPDWLGLTGQAVLEVTAGPVFRDDAGELTGIRRRLEWYPDDLWRHLVAVDWARLGQELPFVGRTAARGDDLGSRLLTARLAQVSMHLGFLLERRWPPYAKWFGTAFAALPHAGAVRSDLLAATRADTGPAREAGLVAALRALARLQGLVGLPEVTDPVEPFWDRPFHGIRESVVRDLLDSVTDPQVRALPLGVGSAEQWSENVDVLVHAERRRARP